MKPMSTQTLILIIWGSLLGVGVLALGIRLHAFEASAVFVPLIGLFGLCVTWVSVRITKAIESVKAEAAQAKSEAAIERARSEMPPALKDAKITVMRARMPSVEELVERPATVPGAPLPAAADTAPETPSAKLEAPEDA